MSDYRFRDGARDGAKIGGLTILISAVALILVIILGSMWIFGYGFFQRGTADFRGKTQQIEKTRANANYRIAAYEHFYDLCAAVQTDEDTIATLKQELAGNPSESRRAQITTNLTALQLNRFENINQYNVDARKTDTQGHFLASDLPYQLDKTAEVTTCSAS